MGRIGHPHRRQFSGAVAACQLFRISTIRLDPVSWLGRHQTGCDHLAGNPHLRQLPIHHVPSGTSLIAYPQMLDWPQFVNQFANGFQLVGDHSQPVDLPVCFSNRHRDGLRVDIQTDKAYLGHSDQLLSYAALRRWFSPIRSVTRVHYGWAVGRSILTSPALEFGHSYACHPR